MSARAKPARVRHASAQEWANEVRKVLRDGGSAKIAKSTQRFFQETVESHGWRTADLRRFAQSTAKQIALESGLDVVVETADLLFTGKNNEETHSAVMMLEKRVRDFGDAEFARFGGWLDRITNWSQHDALVHSLIGPMVAADTSRVANSLKWTKSKNRWIRRAAAVSLIHPARHGLCLRETTTVTNALLGDSDDMVQKGLGWLLREWGKADAAKIIPLVRAIRERAPRLVLRTACETLPAKERARLMEPPAAARSGTRVIK